MVVEMKVDKPIVGIHAYGVADPYFPCMGGRR